MMAQTEDAEEEFLLPPDDRKARFARYAMRDKLIQRLLAAYIVKQLHRYPRFRPLYERALLETDGHAACHLLFSEIEEEDFRRQFMAQQKVLKLPELDVLRLEEAVTQTLPMMRRGKLLRR